MYQNLTTQLSKHYCHFNSNNCHCSMFSRLILLLAKRCHCSENSFGNSDTKRTQIEFNLFSKAFPNDSWNNGLIVLSKLYGVSKYLCSPLVEQVSYSFPITQNPSADNSMQNRSFSSVVKFKRIRWFELGISWEKSTSFTWSLTSFITALASSFQFSASSTSSDITAATFTRKSIIIGHFFGTLLRKSNWKTAKFFLLDGYETGSQLLYLCV